MCRQHVCTCMSIWIYIYNKVATRNIDWLWTPSHLRPMNQGGARPLIRAKVLLAIGSHPECHFNGEQDCIEDPGAADIDIHKIHWYCDLFFQILSNHVKPIILMIISNYPTSTQSSATEFSESRAWKNMPDGEKGNRHGYSSHPPHIKRPPRNHGLLGDVHIFGSNERRRFFIIGGWDCADIPITKKDGDSALSSGVKCAKIEIPKLNKERSTSRKNHQTLFGFFHIFSANRGIHCQMVSVHSRKSDISRWWLWWWPMYLYSMIFYDYRTAPKGSKGYPYWGSKMIQHDPNHKAEVCDPWDLQAYSFMNIWAVTRKRPQVSGWKIWSTVIDH